MVLRPFSGFGSASTEAAETWCPRGDSIRGAKWWPKLALFFASSARASGGFVSPFGRVGPAYDEAEALGVASPARETTSLDVNGTHRLKTTMATMVGTNSSAVPNNVSPSLESKLTP